MISVICNSYFFLKQYLSTSIDDSPYDDLDMEIEIYKAEKRYYGMDGNTESNQLLKKQSINIKTFKCGYCSRHINVPVLMYSDNAFCKIECRNGQIQHDKNNKNNKNNNNNNPYARIRNYTI
jgi:hypothetical protein